MTERGPDPDETAARERALANARAALGVAADVPALIWPVVRIKSAAPGFFLVVFGAPQAAVGLAAVDRVSGEVLAKAQLPGQTPHQLMSAEEAIERSGLGAGTHAMLAWDPVPASRSPFYPLWQLRSGDKTMWINSVTGAACDTLDAPRGGGSA